MNPPTPTLCLVLDGARIVSYEVCKDSETARDFARWETESTATNYRVVAIPLSLCAIAPEMRYALERSERSLGELQGLVQVLRDERELAPSQGETLIRATKTTNEARSLLSRID